MEMSDRTMVVEWIVQVIVRWHAGHAILCASSHPMGHDKAQCDETEGGIGPGKSRSNKLSLEGNVGETDRSLFQKRRGYDKFDCLLVGGRGRWKV